MSEPERAAEQAGGGAGSGVLERPARPAHILTSLCGVIAAMSCSAFSCSERGLRASLIASLIVHDISMNASKAFGTGSYPSMSSSSSSSMYDVSGSPVSSRRR